MSTLQQSAQPSSLESLVDQIAANQNLQNLLADLPDRTRRSVMVPFGDVAFFPGQLVHTNECLVNMGAGVIAEKSAKETASFLQQQQLQLEAQVAALQQQSPAAQHSQQQAGTITPSQAMSQSSEYQEQILDIREPYAEDLHGKQQTLSASKHMQHQIPHATVTSGTAPPSSSWASQQQASSPTHQANNDLPAHSGLKSDDGDFERMMAKLDQLEQQEVAADGRATSAGVSGSTPDPQHLQQDSTTRQQKQQKVTVLPSSVSPALDKRHVRPPTGLKRGFLGGKPNSNSSQQTTRATLASQNTSGAGQGTSGAGQGVSRAGQGSSGAVESQLQQVSTSQSSQPAFTGSVVERPGLAKGSAVLDEPPMQLPQISNGSPNNCTTGLITAKILGQDAEKPAPKKVSKFKQLRNAR